MKVVVNRCFGGFGISDKAADFISKRKGVEIDPWDYRDNRSDPDLVAAVETLGKEADGDYANLDVVEIPDGIDYYIHEYDGRENIHETHRSW